MRFSSGDCRTGRWCLCFHPGMMLVDRGTKSDAHAVVCFYLNNGHNHSSYTVKVLKSSTGGVYYSSEIA